MPRKMPKWPAWQPGTTGKGVMTPMGSVYAWATRDIDDEFRTHGDAYFQLHATNHHYDTRAAAFIILEDGGVDFHAVSDDAARNKVLAAHPEWYDAHGAAMTEYYGE